MKLEHTITRSQYVTLVALQSWQYVTAKTLADQLGTSSTNIYSRLKKLRESGWVEFHHKGKRGAGHEHTYKLTPLGQEIASKHYEKLDVPTSRRNTQRAEEFRKRVCEIVEPLMEAGMNQSEVARTLGISRQRVSQILKRAEKLAS